MVSTALAPIALSSPVSQPCTFFPKGHWSICSFATYSERQKNPNQCDIHHFKVMEIDSKSTIFGLVSVVKTNLTYYWNATCQSASYPGTDELHLQFSADRSSGLNNCSGLFTSTSSIFAAAMYIGGPDLESGDRNYTLCEGGRYGVAAPPGQKGGSCEKINQNYWKMT